MDERENCPLGTVGKYLTPILGGLGGPKAWPGRCVVAEKMARIVWSTGSKLSGKPWLVIERFKGPIINSFVSHSLW